MNAYGRSKLAGEHAVFGVDPAFAVLRVPILYGPTVDLGESAVTSLLLGLRAGQGRPLPMDAWAIRYPTYTPDIALWICRLAHHRAPGIFQGSGDEPWTKADMARILAGLDGLDPACVIAVHEPGPGAPRPRDCHLACDRLQALGIPPCTPFRKGLAQVL